MAITPIRPISQLGLKDAFDKSKSSYSTQGQNGFYRDPKPGTAFPRTGMYAYVNPENGTSEVRIAPEK